MANEDYAHVGEKTLFKQGVIFNGTTGFNGTTPVAKPAALTAADASTVDGTYGAEEALVLANVRTRLNELVAAMTSYGFVS